MNRDYNCRENEAVEMTSTRARRRLVRGTTSSFAACRVHTPAGACKPTRHRPPKPSAMLAAICRRVSLRSAPKLVKPVMKPAKLSTIPMPPAEEAGASSLVSAVLTTFGTYVIADTLSNFIQHPTQKMDYGFINKYLGRPVDQAFWGTRTQHIVGVAACLAVTDHASQAFFSAKLGHPLCFASAPGVFIAHTFFFIFAGVAVYVALDSAFNPTLVDRKAELNSGLYSTYVGSCTAWFEPFVGPMAGKAFGAGFGNSWFGSALLPATLAYTTVKGVGESSLRDSNGPETARARAPPLMAGSHPRRSRLEI